MGFIAFVVAGESLLQAINQPVPAFYHRVAESKWKWGLGAWFVGNQIQSTLLTTGAFEIYVNDVLEYSKLSNGVMPDGNAIARILKKYQIDV